MEDLALRDARFGDVAKGATPDEAVAVATTLAELHRRFWESSRFATDLAVFTPPAARSVAWGPHTSHLLLLLPRRYHDVVPRQVRVDARVLRTQRWAVAEALRRFPLTLLHSDTHLGNICFVGDKPILFDWQTAAQGPGLKDLAYFAATSLAPDTRRAIEHDLLIEYLDVLAANSGPRIPRSEAWDDYRLLAVTAYTAAAVTAAFSGRLQGEAATRAGLDRAAQAVQDLDSFALLRNRLER
jgi:thiamine kinase-like enzyme